MRSRNILLVAACLAAPLLACAHGDIHDQIVMVTRQIQLEPENAKLYLKRGELHRVHGDWDSALSDYDQVARLAPTLADVDFYRGMALLESGLTKPARACLDKFLAKQPDHAEGLITRARALAKLGEGKAAAMDFSHALSRMAEPKPDYYLERAQALASAGDAHLAEALCGLEEGMKRLGPLLSLQLKTIDLEVSRKNLDGALLRLDKILGQSPRRETWLVRKGQLLQQAGRVGEARESFAGALRAIESLPPNHRNSRAMIALENQVRAALGTPALAAVAPR